MVQVVEKFVSHFKNFLGTMHEVSSLNSLEDIFRVTLNDQVALDMVKDVTDEEIKESMFDIESNKVDGPDGYSFCFFKKT